MTAFADLPIADCPLTLQQETEILAGIEMLAGYLTGVGDWGRDTKLGKLYIGLRQTEYHIKHAKHSVLNGQ